MKRGWQIATLALGLVCALFAYDALSMSLIDALGPGPGFFPFVLGALGVLLAAVLLMQIHRGQLAELTSEALSFDRAGARTVVLVVLGLAVATAALELLGYRPTLLALIAYLLWVAGIRSSLVIGLFGLAGSFGVYHVFSAWLKVPLPVGIFGL